MISCGMLPLTKKKPSREEAMKVRNALLSGITALAVLAAMAPFGGNIRAVRAAGGPRVLTGSIEGAAYSVDVPAHWNKTLILYSHGYSDPGPPPPAGDLGETPLGEWWL